MMIDAPISVCLMGAACVLLTFAYCIGAAGIIGLLVGRSDGKGY